MSSKKILIGISGGIAAYKTLPLIRLFVKNGYEVRVVATQNALEFVTPLTIETLSNNALYADMFVSKERDIQHISLAQWADAVVVAPATANIIGKFANGIADDALSTALLATKKPLFFAPAMNCEMYSNAAVQKNIETLKSRGVYIIEPQAGFLACNTQGNGRMEEPETIFEIISHFFRQDEMPRKKALVTAGPTYEPIDAVRFIGNRSSGLMGFCLAEALAKRGYEVDLITGVAHLQIQSPHIHRIDVSTAEEMLQACEIRYKEAEIIIMAAAVADYTPEQTHTRKLKKQEQPMTIALKPTTDILKKIASKKTENQIVVGFALETDNEIEHAKQKLHDKNLDFIVLNSLNDKGAGFGTATNKVALIDKNENITELPLNSKEIIADKIVEIVLG
ncbi:MAG: bifunctional phosphopantothenoylcysteine decarboxylase/phosphopantothenate--cysteine ligase CoaBC [Lentimicrobiaceae bacterium]|nr:bifunctional phosphopantothenoylcysteine decarboxylase/phosphopantothenate--cysteine ligase CoaBC [Lentimicrobiaceae bacterium]